jgi:pimeloyl-ACP methyl ester carboxylesterase
MAGRTFVLVHGAWHGGWCWRHVADALREHGHRVFTPTCTGLGERAHLLSPSVTIDTFIEDIAAVLLCEELEDAVLVGHSFAGIVISGVADRMPERLRHLVYLDAVVLENGQCGFDILPPGVPEERTRLAQETSGGLSVPCPEPEAFGVSEPDQAAWLRRRLTPHPLRCYQSPLRLDASAGNGRPCTYIACSDPFYAPLAGVRERIRGEPGWTWREIATGHDAMVSDPVALTAMLEEVAEA